MGTLDVDDTFCRSKKSELKQRIFFRFINSIDNLHMSILKKHFLIFGRIHFSFDQMVY